MTRSPPQAVVAGHICLDLIPALAAREADLLTGLRPGALLEVGPVVWSAGGAVSNTGLALHRLGVPTRLLGKVGRDLFGQAIRDVLDRHDPALSRGLIECPEEPSSYTIVISPPGADRVFLHCPGANNSFTAADVPYDELAGVRLFHFGYPPMMRRMYAAGGAELETMLRRVGESGVVASLDMCMPDPAADSGRVEWRGILQRVLPYVYVFLPSLDEILFMLDRPRFERRSARGGASRRCDFGLLAEVAGELLAMGAAIVGLKLGDEGFYVRTAAGRERLAALRTATDHALDGWCGRELWSPCFQVQVAGTTGCGDCTIAGFLAGLLRGAPLEDAATAAVAVGACNVEQPDAISGIPTWDAVQARVGAGWVKCPTGRLPQGWTWDPDRGLAWGLNDRGGDDRH